MLKHNFNAYKEESLCSITHACFHNVSLAVYRIDYSDIGVLPVNEILQLMGRFVDKFCGVNILPIVIIRVEIWER